MNSCMTIHFLVLSVDRIELFISYLDLYFSSQRKEGHIIFHAVSKDVPPGVPVDEMNLISVTLSIYDPDDCTVKDQQELLDKRIMRISNEAYAQGALLTQADISILLGAITCNSGILF